MNPTPSARSVKEGKWNCEGTFHCPKCSCDKQCECPAAPDADAGGWRERFDKKAKITKWVGSEFHDCDATESGLEYRADMEKIKAFIQQEFDALIDEAVREVEKQDHEHGRECEDEECHVRQLNYKAIATLNSLRQRQ